MTDQLEISNLTTGYGGKPILRNMSLSVAKGEVLAVIGQNGCGKSTLLKTIARIISDNSGTVTFNGVELAKKHPWDLRSVGISYSAQEGMVFPTLSVREHMDFALRDSNSREADEITRECLSKFPALLPCMDVRGGNLSGGQRQMLSFAMLLCQQSQCWLLDEPMSGLSPSAVQLAIQFLQTIHETTDKTILLVEHNYPVAFQLADRVAVIKDGELYDTFPKTEFLKEDFLDTHLYS
jgi:ABC-type branched-subunit amino acid transport system ATPase component